MNFEYAVVIFPFLYELNNTYPFRPLHQMIHQFCSENQIAVLDLFDAYEGMSYRDLWVHPSDQHPNERGHEIAAHAIGSFILEKGLLGPRSQSKEHRDISVADFVS